MTAAFLMLAPDAEPLPHDPYRIKWTVDAAGQWVRNLVLRNGNDEFVLRRLPDITITETERSEHVPSNRSR